MLHFQIVEARKDIKPPADKKPKQFIYFFGTEN